MGAADNSTVKITIDVVDANSGKVIAATTKNVEGLGNAGAEAGKKLASGITAAGDAGVAVGGKIGRGMKEADGHMLTSLDYVRQFRDVFGIHIPRSMEKFLSQSKLAMGVIGGLGSAMLALGGIEIFAHIIEGSYKAIKAIGDVTGKVHEYALEAGKAAQQKLFDTGPIETQRAAIQQLTADIEGYNKKRREAGVGEDGSGSLVQFAGKLIDPKFERYTKHDDEVQADLRKRRDDAVDRQRQLDQQSRMEALQAANAVRLIGLEGEAARITKKRGDDAVASLKLQQTQEEQNALYRRSVDEYELAKRTKKDHLPVIYKPDPNAGKEEYIEAIAKDAATTSAEAGAEARKQRQETLHLQAEAHSAELRGEAKYASDLAEAQRQLKFQHDQTLVNDADYYERSAALNRKYQAERKKRLEDEHAETLRMQVEAASGGLKGLARVDAGVNTQLAGIAKEAPGFSDPATKAAREAAARQRGQQEQQQEMEAFSERIQQLDDSRADSTMSTNQRIDAATRRAQAEIRKAWEETYGQLGALDQRRVQSYQALQQELVRMTQSAEREKLQARQVVEDETTKTEAEAGRRGLTREQEAPQAIIDEYNQRYHQLEELRTKDADNADLYRRQEVAAEQIKNGKLIEQQREMRDKLAGQLRGFMNNPLEALKRAGEDAASKYAADLILKTTGGNLGVGKGGGGVFGLPFGRKGDAGASGHTAAATASVSAASTTLTAGTATIHVGVANFASLPGTAAAASGVPGLGGGFNAGNAGAFGQLPGASATSIPGAAGGWSTTSGSYGDHLGGGFTSTGGPAVAALGGSGGTLGTLQSLPGMGTDISKLGKELGMGDLGAKGTALAGKAGISAGTLGKLGSAAGGAAGLFSAYQSNGGFGGALSGAMSGAQLGGTLGGPVGAAIGAVAGGIMGLFGFGGASKAAEYDRKQVRPRRDADLLAFGMGSMGYQDAYDDLNKLDAEARQQTKQWGPGGERQYNNHIKGEIRTAMDQLTREQKAGRSKYGMTAAQFHDGGEVRGFGDFRTGPDSGFAHLQIGETVMHQQATQTHGDALAMMLGGATREQMAAFYGGTSPASGGGDINLNFHSHDARGTYQLFMDNKHNIREALNASYAENSGGTD